ncbi:hypothetical protein [Sphingomonas sp. SAFR-052]|uniref:hypothetical protein n=1 Tax=Sphingomonas sp. SAFR-052 TaxID=3436867 RepID=UPI003F7D92CF
MGYLSHSSITLIIHDANIDAAAIEKAVRSALDECLPFRCKSICLQTPASGGRTILFSAQPSRPDDGQRARQPYIATERIDAHCDLLDSLGVANGTKAIAIALHANWTDAHRERFGEAANPASVKRWRTMRRRGPRSGAHPPVRHTRRNSGPARVARGLCRHHAVRVSAGGGSMREGYERAMAELRVVNEGGHRFYCRPDRPLPLFSYETFRRDCHTIRRRNGQT